MSGIIWAFIAAISFGLFQTINRKAGIQIHPVAGVGGPTKGQYYL